MFLYNVINSTFCLKKCSKYYINKTVHFALHSTKSCEDVKEIGYMSLAKYFTFGSWKILNCRFNFQRRYNSSCSNCLKELLLVKHIH